MIEMFGAVFDVDAAHVLGAAAAADDTGLWREGYIRLFLSHSARHKAFAAKVSSALEGVGIVWHRSVVRSHGTSVEPERADSQLGCCPGRETREEMCTRCGIAEVPSRDAS